MSTHLTLYSYLLLIHHSALNFMAYQRASTADYDGWTQLGNPHWSWSTLLPYFKKAETYTPERPDQKFPGAPSTNSNSGIAQFEGDCGPIKVGQRLYTPDAHLISLIGYVQRLL